jgi:hypothetical protein
MIKWIILISALLYAGCESLGIKPGSLSPGGFSLFRDSEIEKMPSFNLINQEEEKK